MLSLKKFELCSNFIARHEEHGYRLSVRTWKSPGNDTHEHTAIYSLFQRFKSWNMRICIMYTCWPENISRFVVYLCIGYRAPKYRYLNVRLLALVWRLHHFDSLKMIKTSDGRIIFRLNFFLFHFQQLFFCDGLMTFNDNNTAS